MERNPIHSIIFHAASMAERVGHQRSNPKVNSITAEVASDEPQCPVWATMQCLAVATFGGRIWAKRPSILSRTGTFDSPKRALGRSYSPMRRLIRLSLDGKRSCNFVFTIHFLRRPAAIISRTPQNVSWQVSVVLISSVWRREANSSDRFGEVDAFNLQRRLGGHVMLGGGLCLIQCSGPLRFPRSCGPANMFSTPTKHATTRFISHSGRINLLQRGRRSPYPEIE